MVPVQFEDFLKQHSIEFKDGRWRMNSVSILPKNIIGADFFRTQSVFRADEAKLYLNGKMNREPQKFHRRRLVLQLSPFS